MQDLNLQTVSGIQRGHAVLLTESIADRTRKQASTGCTVFGS